MEIDLIEINDSGLEYYIGVPSTTQVTRSPCTLVLQPLMSHQRGY